MRIERFCEYHAARGALYARRKAFPHLPLSPKEAAHHGAFRASDAFGYLGIFAPQHDPLP